MRETCVNRSCASLASILRARKLCILARSPDRLRHPTTFHPIRSAISRDRDSSERSVSFQLSRFKRVPPFRRTITSTRRISSREFLRSRYSMVLCARDGHRNNLPWPRLSHRPRISFPEKNNKREGSRYTRRRRRETRADRDS